jgi:hypothetical protein
MFNPSALGVALLVLLATTAMVGSSSSGNRGFQVAHQSLGSLISSTSADHMMGSYQRQTNTISLRRQRLSEPHQLTISAAPGVTLRGTITINGNTQQSLTLDQMSGGLDLGPYLAQSITDVVIVGTYQPASALVTVTFDGPDTKIQQQAGGTGRVNYQLNLVVD